MASSLPSAPDSAPSSLARSLGRAGIGAAGGGGAGLGDGLERFALMGHVALDRFQRLGMRSVRRLSCTSMPGPALLRQCRF